MDSITLTATSPLGGVDMTIGGNRVAERTTHAVVSIALPQGGEAALASSLITGWSIDMPDATMSTTSGETRAVRTGADQLFLIFPHATPDAEPSVQRKLSGSGYTTDQTDSWVQLEISGPGVMLALERLSPVDLSVDAFPVGASARTIFEHMGTLVIRTGAQSFLLMSAASSAGSFLHAVQTSFEYTKA